MKLSKKSYYGMKFLLALATGAEGEFFGIMQVAIGENIPLKFLEAIAVALKKRGVVEVKRGAGGGYRLLKEPSEISVLDVVMALEDWVEKPLADEPKTSNEKAVLLTLEKVREDYYAMLGKHSLEEMRRLFNDLNENLMYYI